MFIGAIVCGWHPRGHAKQSLATGLRSMLRWRLRRPTVAKSAVRSEWEKTITAVVLGLHPDDSIPDALREREAKKHKAARVEFRRRERLDTILVPIRMRVSATRTSPRRTISVRRRKDIRTQR